MSNRVTHIFQPCCKSYKENFSVSAINMIKLQLTRSSYHNISLCKLVILLFLIWSGGKCKHVLYFQPLGVVRFPHSLSRSRQGDNAGESPLILQLLVAVKAKLGSPKSCAHFVPLEHTTPLLLFQPTAAFFFLFPQASMGFWRQYSTTSRNHEDRGDCGESVFRLFIFFCSRYTG